MRKLILAALGALAVAAFAAGPVAANPTGNRGQPSQDCESSTAAPPGFSTGGFANARQVYAGSPGTPSAANGNSHAVAQYDVACFQLSGH